MKVSKVDYKPVQTVKSKLLGFATVYFDNGLMVDGFSVINGNKGLFAAWPTVKSGKDDAGNPIYKPSVSTTDKEMFKSVGAAVLKAYQDYIRESAQSAQNEPREIKPASQTPTVDPNDEDPFA